METQIKIQLEDVQFNADGTVVIKNLEARNQIKDIIGRSDILSCTTNNGCGNEVNGSGCGKVNASCRESIFTKDDLILTNPNDVLIRNPKFVSDLISDRLKGLEKNEINISLKGFKEIQ
ncbi:MAG: hypothetical protein COW03_01820 [Cytophagales bacterium CG12_big_fil_rev_8_21_14_0_65_40_12]|nr:MAG: hypothetical protein COW03_01820 [Cytophagales bacterium CG12_big_fil_rev_8_21_14_0_65_40_12]PIW05212.1 MAG: hypothetical protein COW40_05715 [Cytophagales bacterium CG17_big_fil_post_rev_8_21_14_2_50_40_13]